MANVTYIDNDAQQHVVDVVSGTTLMQAAVDNLVPGILGDCGGAASCGTCHVHVDPAWMERAGPASAIEADLLEGFLDTCAGSRLACQIAMNDGLDGIVVQVAKPQW